MQVRRRSVGRKLRQLLKRKRAETAVYDEQDDDFHFTRGSRSKRVKNAESDPEAEPEPAPPPAKKSGRGRPSKGRASAAARAHEQAPSVTTPKAATSSRLRTRRTASLLPVEEDEPQLIAPKRTTRRSSRNLTEKPEKEKPVGRPATVAEEDDDMAIAAPMEVERQRTPRVMEEPVESAKITLPISDTPVINRNKEMRKKGGGNRRSSTGMRGRRASSLIESGHNAIPHREVDSAEFYKHIESEGLMEPRRMKQLLTWCGERALLEKPPHGQADSNTVLGGKFGYDSNKSLQLLTLPSSLHPGATIERLLHEVRVFRLVQSGRGAKETCGVPAKSTQHRAPTKDRATGTESQEVVSAIYGYSGNEY